LRATERRTSSTLSGSGEPTLHTDAGDILRFLRERTEIPTALLSNGSLFWRQEVREAATWAHIVKVSLSAWDQPSFNRVNRPHPDRRPHRRIEVDLVRIDRLDERCDTRRRDGVSAGISPPWSSN
jgi:wyosine [tRNA(Phe)-imidazoG37] synthetase (radical SAM superfamily)